jgi:hypothetical protein
MMVDNLAASIVTRGWGMLDLSWSYLGGDLLWPSINQNDEAQFRQMIVPGNKSLDIQAGAATKETIVYIKSEVQPNPLFGGILFQYAS